MPRKRSSYLDTYRTPPACYRTAPVRMLTDEERAKDNATTFRIDRARVSGRLAAAYQARTPRPRGKK